ncbi:hypothetical protein B0T20DRAFT_492814 [Sordaria brevicollis]|uniref:Uncharacterized protein n=1 Tax=Sordaria brevicollis TaxID=83679 RepID=A0AAE0PKY3_SORBR|nr:hypothetical protein B0T20DRAFT_492814 [Sordaria brevicollis]
MRWDIRDVHSRNGKAFVYIANGPFAGWELEVYGEDVHDSAEEIVAQVASYGIEEIKRLHGHPLHTCPETLPKIVRGYTPGAGIEPALPAITAASASAQLHHVGRLQAEVGSGRHVLACLTTLCQLRQAVVFSASPCRRCRHRRLPTTFPVMPQQNNSQESSTSPSVLLSWLLYLLRVPFTIPAPSTSSAGSASRPSTSAEEARKQWAPPPPPSPQPLPTP